MSVTKVTVDGMDLSSDVTLSGTTPTLTIGDAGAEDAAIVFDGNAQDFHIGLDDTADDLVIGLGSALGTTTHMAFDETGAISQPLQPCVLVNSASTQSNLATGTDITVVWGTETFDVGGDFASNTFTAPVTGKYLINYSLRLDDLDSAATYYALGLIASNRSKWPIWSPAGFDQDVPYYTFLGSIVIDMDASDTFVLKVRQEGGTAQTDINSGTESGTYMSIIKVA